MQKYTTTIKAICPIDGKLKTYAGPHVPGISFATAQEYCNQNGLGYCKVDGILVGEYSANGKESNEQFENMN